MLILGFSCCSSLNKVLTILFVAGLAYTNAHFGSGTGSIVLDDVQCVSSDNQLLECSSRPIFSHNCAHSDDAGVGCEGVYKKKVTGIQTRGSTCVIGLLVTIEPPVLSPLDSK